jgi:hypothetical protein
MLAAAAAVRPLRAGVPRAAQRLGAAEAARSDPAAAVPAGAAARAARVSWCCRPRASRARPVQPAARRSTGSSCCNSRSALVAGSRSWRGRSAASARSRPAASCAGSCGARRSARCRSRRLRPAVRARLRPAGCDGVRRSCSALVPLAFASAIVRYRLMDVEVIIKRGLVYAAALAAIAAIYASSCDAGGEVFFADGDAAQLGHRAARDARRRAAGAP